MVEHLCKTDYFVSNNSTQFKENHVLLARREHNHGTQSSLRLNFTIINLLLYEVLGDKFVTSTLSTGILQIVPVIFSISLRRMIATFLNNIHLPIRTLSLHIIWNSSGKLNTSNLFETA